MEERVVIKEDRVTPVIIATEETPLRPRPQIDWATWLPEYDKQLRQRLAYFVAPAGALSAVYSLYARILQSCSSTNVECSREIETMTLLLATVAAGLTFIVQWGLEQAKFEITHRRANCPEKVRVWLDNTQAGINIAIDIVGMHAISLHLAAYIIAEIVKLINKATEVNVSNRVFWTALVLPSVIFSILSNAKLRALLRAFFKTIIQKIQICINNIDEESEEGFFNILDRIVQEERGLFKKILDTFFEFTRGVFEGRGFIFSAELLLSLIPNFQPINSRIGVGIIYGFGVVYGSFTGYLGWRSAPEKDDHYWSSEWPYRIKDYILSGLFMFFYLYNSIVTTESYNLSDKLLFALPMGAMFLSMFVGTLWLTYKHLPRENLAQLGNDIVPGERQPTYPDNRDAPAIPFEHTKSINNIFNQPSSSSMSQSGSQSDVWPRASINDEELTEHNTQSMFGNCINFFKDNCAIPFFRKRETSNQDNHRNNNSHSSVQYAS